MTVCQDVFPSLVQAAFLDLQDLVEDLLVDRDWILADVNPSVLSDLGLEVPRVSSDLVDR